MYDDMVFADRFRYQWTKFEEYILIGLSRLLGTHIAYEIYLIIYLLAIKRLQYIKTIYKYTDKDRGFIRAKALH